MENKEFKYAIIHPNTPDHLYFAQRDVYKNDGTPKFSDVSQDHKYIMFERTAKEDGTEFNSNAVTSDDLSSLVAQAKEYPSYYDYINLEYRNMKGETHTMRA